MVRWRRSEPTAHDYGGSCPDVPDADAWPSLGISGTIGAGPDAGQPVLAVNAHLPRVSAGLVYFLWLPNEVMMAADDETFLMESDVFDVVRTDGTGGLIDLLTRELCVTWSTDPADAQRVHDWYRARP